MNKKSFGRKNNLEFLLKKESKRFEKEKIFGQPILIQIFGSENVVSVSVLLKKQFCDYFTSSKRLILDHK